MQMIRYHPLIDGDTDGLEKVPIGHNECVHTYRIR